MNDFDAFEKAFPPDLGQLGGVRPTLIAGTPTPKEKAERIRSQVKPGAKTTTLRVDGYESARQRMRRLGDLRRDACLKVISRIAAEHGLTASAVLSRSRHATVALARHRAMAVIRWSTSLSYPEIGTIFGRDHTTVMSGIARYEWELNHP